MSSGVRQRHGPGHAGGARGGELGEKVGYGARRKSGGNLGAGLR